MFHYIIINQAKLNEILILKIHVLKTFKFFFGFGFDLRTLKNFEFY